MKNEVRSGLIQKPQEQNYIQSRENYLKIIL